MNNDLVYLRPNVVPEALFNQWYVNSHLISPASAALNIKERHLKIMRSFIESPQDHVMAVQKPEMRGGPFVDYKEDRVVDVEKLYEGTLQKNIKLIALADAIVKLNSVLQDEAHGNSLNEFYPQVPQELKGYVELVYDLNNQPSFRIFEMLLYRNYYDESCQSISLQLISSDESRSFVLSTPRLDDPGIIRLSIPFKSDVWDELFQMIRVPASYRNIKARLGIQKKDEPVFESLFTNDSPSEYNQYDRPGIRTRYFGHAAILIETKNISILADPVISYEYESELNRYTFNDLPEVIDYVLITHNHQDHVNIETLIQLRHKIKHIIVPRCGLGNIQDPSLKIMLNVLGFNNVTELSEMESLEQDGCIITGFPFFGEHSDLDIRSKICYHVKLKDCFTIVLAADSCNIQPETYDLIRNVVGEIDILFLGMECDGAPLSWVYGPLMPKKLPRDKDQARRLAGSDFDQAFRMVTSFNPSHVFVYAMGMEPWLNYISSVKYTEESRPIKESNRLIQKCSRMGINAERLYGEKTLEYDKMNSTEVMI